MPAMFVAGDRDLVLAFEGLDLLIEALPQQHPQFRKPVILPGCGHWTQQEYPGEVNRLLLDFLHSLD